MAHHIDIKPNYMWSDQMKKKLKQEGLPVRYCLYLWHDKWSQGGHHHCHQTYILNITFQTSASSKSSMCRPMWAAWSRKQWTSSTGALLRPLLDKLEKAAANLKSLFPKKQWHCIDIGLAIFCAPLGAFFVMTCYQTRWHLVRFSRGTFKSVGASTFWVLTQPNVTVSQKSL